MVHSRTAGLTVAALLLLPSSRAAAAPNVSSEFEVDVPILTQGPAVPRTTPSVAYNGSIYLAVFVGENAVRARRFDQNLQVLDSSDIVLDAGGSSPNVVADGSDFFVVWTSSPVTKFARMNAAGAITNQGTLPINALQLARGPNGILVAGSQAVFLAGDGQVLNGPFTMPGDCRAADIAYSNDTFLAGCFTYLSGLADDVGYVRFDGMGNLLQATYTSLNLDTDWLTVAANGNEFLLATMKYQTGTCVGRRIALDGTLASPEMGFPQCPDGIAVVNGSYYFGLPGSTPKVRRYSASLAPLDAAPISLSASPGFQVVGASSGSLATFLHLGNGQPNSTQGTVSASAIDSNGVVSIPSTEISSGVANVANQQNAPTSTAMDAAGTVAVVWEDQRVPGSPAIYASFLDPQGSIIGGAAVKVADGKNPRIASNGTSFLVTYEPDDYIHFARSVAVDGSVGPEFQIPDPNGIIIYALAPAALASDGTNYAYLQNYYHDDPVVSDDLECAIGRLDPDGNAIDAPRRIYPEVVSCRDLFFDDSNYFALFATGVERLPNDNAIQSLRMSPAGVLDAQATLIASSQRSVAGAFGNGQRVVVRSAPVPPVSSGEVDLLRLGPDNAVLDINPIQVANGTVYDVAPYGNGFLALHNSTALLANEIDTAGAVGPSFEVSPLWSIPAVLSPNGKFAFYHRYDPSDGFRAYRVRARRIGGALDVGAACENQSDCLSGFCVEGTCCDSACETGACQSGMCDEGGGGAGQGGAEQGGAGQGGAGQGGGASGGMAPMGGSGAGGQALGGGGGSGGATGDDAGGGAAGCGSCGIPSSGTQQPIAALALLALIGIWRRARRNEDG
ncbi:MAG: hypothetical protein HOW73_03525 [Polyangiaceae bacterium]|nr:hypothetical protein [Polyangiaceae bacterium]